MEHIVITCCESIERLKVLVGMCKTRWSERDLSYEHFYLTLAFIVEALGIINGTHPSINTFDEIFTKGWDSNSKKEPTIYINALTIFEFIVGITSLYRLLHPVASITQKLQDRTIGTIDIIKAYQEVQSCILDMRMVRDKIVEEFLVIYRQAERIATSLDVSVRTKDCVKANKSKQYSSQHTTGEI